MKGLSALERNKPDSITQLNLQRIQGLSMLIFYPLEFLSFFSAPWAPVLTSARIITSKQGTKAALWSIRAWLVYTVVQVLLIGREWQTIRAKEAQTDTVTDEDEEQAAREKTAKRKEQIWYSAVANISRLPVIVHWSLVDGFYKHEVRRSLSCSLVRITSG
jgi:hypothetical protein